MIEEKTLIQKKKQLKKYYKKRLREYFQMLEEMQEHNTHLVDANLIDYNNDFKNYCEGLQSGFKKQKQKTIKKMKQTNELMDLFKKTEPNSLFAAIEDACENYEDKFPRPQIVQAFTNYKENK